MNCWNPKSMNIYEQFLQYIRTKTYDDGTKLEFHHEPPRFTGQSDDNSPENVYASFEDHSLLHYYRFLSYRKPQDYIAWMYRVDAKVASSEAGKIGGSKSFQNKSGWFAQDLSENGRIGGNKTGKYHNEHKQSDEYKELVRQNYEWSYNDQPTLCTFNCTNGRQILEELMKFPEYNVKYTKSTVGAVNRSLKKGCSMWGMKPKLIDMVISSQALGTPKEGSETT